MKFTRLGAFTLGVVITAVSVGAVSFVNAASDGTLKACANKKTGVMRYISKGSCNKKTETSLSWNKMGPQGLPGSSGTAGAKGDTGAAGTNGTAGTSGTNGKTLVAVDATGKEIGNVLGDGQAFGVTPDFVILSSDRLWRVNSTEYTVNGSGYSPDAYSDSACTLPLGLMTSLTPSAQLTFGYVDASNGGKTYIATTKYADALDMTMPVYRGGRSSCILDTTFHRTDTYGSTQFFYSLTEISTPTYVAPLLVVLK